MTAPSPALIPIDPEALEVAMAMVHSAPDVPLPDILEAAIRAYLAASGLPAVVAAAERLSDVAIQVAVALNVNGMNDAIAETRAALAAIKGGGDAG